MNAPREVAVTVATRCEASTAQLNQKSFTYWRDPGADIGKKLSVLRGSPR
jgi:hypothetical protein